MHFIVHSRPLLLVVLGSCAAIGTLPPGNGSLQSSARTVKPAPAPELRIDVNHASVDELLKVPGMTPTWASRIVRFRPYRTKQDLLDDGVVPSNIYDRIKNYVIAHRDAQ